MKAAAYQIRICQNPACGLRFPWVMGQPFGDRCPVCLGDTIPVFESASTAEMGGETRAQVNRDRLAVLVDNVRSAWNVGSILRSADGFGFGHAYLCGITPTPDNAAVRKTALGAAESVTWSAHKDAVKLVHQLKDQGHYIIALEAVEDAVPLAELKLGIPGPETIVLIVGNEVTGVDPGLLQLAQEIVCLPMQGRKRSFNVAVAFGAAAYQIGRMLGGLT